MDINEIKNKIKVAFDMKNLGIDDLLYDKILDKIAYYIKGVTNISKELITEDYLIYELSKLDVIRIGDFNKELDSNLMHMGNSLISEYTRVDRPKSMFEYALKDNKFVSILVLFGSKEVLLNGEMVNLQGLDFNNDLELTKELYLGLTKYLSTTIIKHQNLNKLTYNGVDYQDGISVNNHIILNGITNQVEDLYEGLTTYEYHQKEEKLYKYEYLSKLINEYITNLVLKDKGESVLLEDTIASKLSNKYKDEVFITKYLINSRKLIKEMEKISLGDLNVLHYIEMNHDKDDYESTITNYLNLGEFIRPITKEQCYEFYSKYVK